MTRRGFVCAAPLFLAACSTSGITGSLKPAILKPAPAKTPPSPKHEAPAYYREIYAAIDNDQFPIPAPNLSKIDPKYYRQEVSYSRGEAPGTVVVETQKRFLYYVLPGGRAIRYGVGVGAAGLAFEGEGVIQYKRKWPRWTPTPDMIRRQPKRYGPLAGGMEPGPKNPLGSRALYLFKNGQDTLYRIHGTNEDWSIGRAMSSGCIRMLNQDVIDLHLRVLNGARVVVIQGSDAGTV